MSFKRGDVVQHNQHKWIGVVESFNSIVETLFGQWVGSVIWFEGEGCTLGISDGKDYSDIDLAKIDGYEMEAALYLGDIDRARQLYNDMKQQRDQAIIMAVPELHRRYQLTLKLGADTIDDLDGALNTVQFDVSVLIDKQYLNRNYHSVSGGPTRDWTLDIAFDPDMTHDRHFEQIKAYLEQKRGN